MLGELIELHRRIIEQSGGADGIRDLGLAESALAQPQMSFGGTELYPTLAEKAAAMCFSLVMNIRSSTVSNESATQRWRRFS
jgi:death-on-curing protein